MKLFMKLPVKHLGLGPSAESRASTDSKGEGQMNRILLRLGKGGLRLGKSIPPEVREGSPHRLGYVR